MTRANSKKAAIKALADYNAKELAGKHLTVLGLDTRTLTKGELLEICKYLAIKLDKIGMRVYD